jgi:hypothetical protein
LEWLIIAKDQAILEHRIARLRKRGAKEIAAFEKKREEERQAQEGERQAREAAAAVQHENHAKLMASLSQLGEQWDVTRRYEIKCRSMTENYYEPPNGFWLEIHCIELAEDHAAEMFAQFDLGLLEGWLRFRSA